MKQSIFWSCCLMVALLIAGCTPNKDPWPHGIRYEIFVRSFADSNGDGIGDLNGVTDKLDYLHDLGVSAIWLMPVMPSPSYHKYDVTDYKSIDPEYGTIGDFRNLIAEAHRRKIRVIIDLVVNHTGNTHPWFIGASEDPRSPLRQYYVWARRDSIRKQIAKKTVTLDSDNITQWHPVDGDTISEQYYGFFWGGMPDLNMDHPQVRQELVDIGRFWLDSIGVDGFRLDAARHIFPDERAADNHAFWKWFRSEMRKIKPNVYLVGEVWASAQEVAPYLPGLPSLFNFDMAYAIADVIRAGRDSIKIAQKYHVIDSAYRAAYPDFLDAVFLRNHDQNRILSELQGNTQKAKLAASFLMTMPGTPYIFYGEEIGMTGKKPDEQIREPFLWDVADQDVRRTTWELPVYSTDKTVVPLRLQESDAGSLYNHYRNWMRYRNSDPVLTFGDFKPVQTHNSVLVAFLRSYGNEYRLVVHNLSDSKVVHQMSGLPMRFSSIRFGNGKMDDSAGSIQMEPYSTLVLED